MYRIYPCFIPYILFQLFPQFNYHYSVFSIYQLYAIIILIHDIKGQYQLSLAKAFYSIVGIVVAYILFKVVFLGF
jgi:hypothetical protein